MKTSSRWSRSWFGLLFLTLSVVGFSGGLVSCGGSDDGTTDETVSANAGDDQEVLVDAEVSLDGLSSTGVDTAAWTFTSVPTGSAAAITGADTLSASFTPDVVGDYVVELSINSGEATDSVTITANSVVAEITLADGSAITTRTRFGETEYVVNTEQPLATLSAATSEGTVATYSWTQVAGPAATITSADTTSSTLEFTGPTMASFLNDSDRYKWQPLPISRDDTKMIFQLTVTDADGNTNTSTVEVFVADSNGNELHTSSGLNNVGVGERVYLAGADKKSSTVAITDWSWTLTVPSGSSAEFDGGGTTSAVQIPSFVPDVAGVYTVAYTSTTGNTAALLPSVKVPGEILINAAEYAGVGTIGGTTPVNPQCANCHDGGVEADKVTEWSATKHATIFEDSMSIYDDLAPEPYLWQYHTVGYNADADNGGFDDLASADGFVFPTTGMTFDEFTGAYPDTAVLSNVQCESCHGPGSEHSGDTVRIDLSVSNTGVCGQCHIQEAEWKNSSKNSTSSYASGTNSTGTSGWMNYTATGVGNPAVCARCHVGKGFLDYLDAGTQDDGTFDYIAAQAGEEVFTNDSDSFGGVTCATCHDPHDSTNSFHLRWEGTITMAIDDSIVNAGKGAVCYGCHMGNRELYEPDCDSDADGVYDTECMTLDQTATEYPGGGYHDTSQGTMLEGNQALPDLDGDGVDDMTLDENSFHSDDEFILSEVTGDATLASTNNKCVTCHMAAGPGVDEEGYQQVGGHTFKMVSDDGTVENLSACTSCHSETTINEETGFNRIARGDYDGDGEQEGIQDEVKGLLVSLTTQIKALDTIHVNQNTDVIQTSATTGTSGSYVVTTATATEAAGDIHVGTIGINGATAALTAACSTQTNQGIWTSTAATGKRVCNFNAMDDALKRAIWNVNSVVNDESLGIHNAAYTIQILQGTYTALANILGGTDFDSAFPNADIR